MKQTKEKLFGTDGIRGKANIYPMTPEIALAAGKAVAKTFMKLNKNKTKHTIVIGKDTRLSGYMFESALEAGIVSNGVDVMLVGPLPTPAIAHLTKSFNADAGIVISASHNPSEDNGIKIFGSDGYKLDDNIEKEIEDLIFKYLESNTEKIPGSNKLGKAYKVEEAKGRYIEFVKSSIESLSLSGLKIVLDCANGAAYGVAPKIFSELGAEVISLNIDPNGENINEGCGATHPEEIVKAVKKNKADFGIALDGDADRIVMCDEKGEILTGDEIIAILATEMKKEDKLENNSVVITVMSNIGLKKYLENEQIDYVETQVGDRYVIEEMKNKGINIGGEQSGHVILTDFVTTGDGIMTGLQIAKIVKLSGEPLSRLMGLMKRYPQVLININVKEKKDIKTLNSFELIEEIESSLKDKGRILVRYSGTENLCRVMVEAENKKDAEEMAEKVANSIKKEIGQ